MMTWLLRLSNDRLELSIQAGKTLDTSSIPAYIRPNSFSDVCVDYRDMTKTFDAIVIGAGAMGSAAAYYLSKRDQRVLLLEQFELDHRNGSSYGHSRIIRYCYDRSEYVELAIDNYPLWFTLQEELGEALYVKTGGFDFGPADDDRLQDTLAAINANNIEYEMLSVEEARYRFPQFQLNADFQVLYQADGGFIKASKARTRAYRIGKAPGRHC